MGGEAVRERPAWRRMPLFIASTFRDMDYERDALVRLAIPVVNERLRESGRSVSLYPVDLRWGIETDASLDIDTRLRTILDTCVAEVRRCRPLFLGLLGSRYGTVPSEHLGPTLFAAAGLDDPGLPTSITLIEMLTAAQANDGVAPILLSRRAPLADRVAADEAGVREDLPGSAGAEALDRMRAHFAAIGRPFTPYDAYWSPEDRQYRSATFVELATKALLATVEQVVARDALGDWLDAELAAQHWSAEQEVRQFVGRAEELEFIRDFWDSGPLTEPGTGDRAANPLWRKRFRFGPSALAVVGDSGSGKSALLAKVATDADLRVGSDHSHSRRRAYVRIGATAASERLPVCILVLLAQLDPTAAGVIAARHSAESLRLEHVLGTWIETLADNVPTYGPLIVVDGLDRLVGAIVESPRLAWMPTMLGDRAHFVVSTTNGSGEEWILGKRPSTHVFTLGPLTRSDATALVLGRAAAHHRTLPTGLADALTRTSTSPRWLAVATQLLLTLMAFDYLALRDIDESADPEAALRLLLHKVTDSLPEDLERLHVETLDRLVTLLGPQFAVPLCILGATLFGIDDTDLRAILNQNGTPLLDADLALLRGVLTEHVQVRRGEWRFAHQSAADAIARVLDDEGEQTGVDLQAAYHRMVARHLLAKPVNDPIRVRELLTQMWLAGERELMVRGLAFPEFASDPAIQIFAMAMAARARATGSALECMDLVEAATSKQGLLDIIELLATHVFPAVPRPILDILPGACREWLAAMPPDLRSRAGATAADITVLLTDASTADMASLPHHFGRLWEWFAAAAVEGRGSLHDAPVPAPARSGMEQTYQLGVDLQMMIEYALAVRAEAIASDPNDGPAFQARLGRWRAVVEADPTLDADRREYRRLLLATAERAGNLAWPRAGFHPDDGEFTRLVTLTDRARNLGAVLLLGHSARVRAMELTIDLFGVQLAGADYDRIDTALRYLDEALWQIELQLTLDPGAMEVELVAIQCGILHGHLLAQCDQHASAARSTVAVFSRPHATQLLAGDMFIVTALTGLHEYLQAPLTSVDPTPMVECVAAELDRRRTAGAVAVDEELAELSGGLDTLLLAVALSAARRHDGYPLAARMLDRAIAAQRDGLIRPDPDTAADALTREFLADAEDELLSIFENVLTRNKTPQPGDYDPIWLAATADGLYQLRMILFTRSPGEPSDAAGAAFCEALRVAFLGRAERRAEATRLRAIARNGTDGRTRAVIAATDVLLALPETSVART